jgi:hypothetical protein
LKREEEDESKEKTLQFDKRKKGKDRGKKEKKGTHRLDLHVGLVGLYDDDGLPLGDLVSGLLQPRDDLR